MKKLLIILLGIFPLVLSSCLKEDDDKFDNNTAARVEEFKKNAIKVLEGAENGWAVKYYPSPTQEFGGFNLFFKFENGEVTVCSEMNDASNQVTSLYSLSQEAGVTMTFDTKNELINYFVHPRNPDGYGSNYKGLEGDFLWTIMSAAPEKVVLRGVKTGSKYTLTPLETSDWTSEMQTYQLAARNMKFASYVCVIKGDSLECLTTGEGNFMYRNFTIRQDTKDGIESYDAPFIYTKTGIELYEPLTINGVTAQKLDLKEDYYFANEDDSFIISGPAPIVSDNQIAFGTSTVTYNSINIPVTTTNADSYFIGAFLPSELAGLTDKEIKTAICGQLSSSMLNSGNATASFSSLYDETEYVLIAFGVDPVGLSATTDIFRMNVTTDALPNDLRAEYKDWLGTWTVTSTTSELTNTSQSFDIVIRPRVKNSSFFISGWGYTYVKDDYEFSVNYTSSTNSFRIFKTVVDTAFDGNGSLSLLPRTIDGSGSYGMLNTSSWLLQASSTGTGTGVVTGRSGSFTDGRTFTVVSVDYWNVKDGSTYYLQVLSPYTYKDFLVGPYTMVKKSDNYKPTATRAAISTLGKKSVISTNQTSEAESEM